MQLLVELPAATLVAVLRPRAVVIALRTATGTSSPQTWTGTWLPLMFTRPPWLPVAPQLMPPSFTVGTTVQLLVELALLARDRRTS